MIDLFVTIIASLCGGKNRDAGVRISASDETRRESRRYTSQKLRRYPMRSKQSAVRLLAMMAVVALVCTHAEAWRYSAMSESESFHAASDTKVMKHSIAAPWTRARLKVTMHVAQGAAVLRLIDPDGSTRLEKTLERGDSSIDQTFAGNGIWRVELQFKDASGKYSVQLIAA
jgi:predicted DNA-binding protein (UPF0251 family)